MVLNTHMSLGDYEASVLVEGAEVEHYKIEVDEVQKTATCWIASEEGKRFTLKAKKTHTLFDCTFNVRLDGHGVGAKLLNKDHVQAVFLENIVTGPQTAKPFVFGALKVTDDEALLEDSQVVKNLGEIQMTLQRVSNVTGSRPYSETAPKVPQVHAVHERAKKAAPHRVKYGDQITYNATWKDCTYNEIVAKFIFRYTSLDMLKAMDIVNRQRTPPEASLTPGTDASSSVNKGKRKADSVKSEDASDDDLSPEELQERETEAKLQAQLEDIRKARESRMQDKHTKKKVKLEFKPTFVPGEVIDLT